jgi:hypothetical protein
MARYFFHLTNGSDVLLDPEGRELENGTVAAAALSEARAIIAADIQGGSVDLDQNIEVQDSTGIVIHCIAFEDALRITHRLAG